MTRTANSRGFTLIEVVIGVALMLVLMVFFLTIIRGGTRESALSSDHFTAAMLSQKTIEDLMEEVDLNPLGLSALGIEESSPLPPTSIVDGVAPFFQNIEDRKAPWGKIDSQNEGAIDAAVAPLYGQVKTFTVSATGKRLTPAAAAPENIHLLEAGISFDWKAKVGKGKVGAGCVLFSPVGAKPASTTLSFSQADVEKEIARLFFNSHGEALAKLCTDSGANYDSVLSLGIIHYSTLGFINSNGLKGFLQEVGVRQTKAQGPFSSKVEEYIAKQNLGKAYFDLGNACFLMTYILATDVMRLENKCNPADLGSIVPDNPDNFTTGLVNYGRIYDTFQESMRKSRNTYRSLLDSNLSGVRGIKQQMFVIKRLFDLYLILAALPDYPNGPAHYKAFLDNLGKEMDGRNPYLYRYILQEKDFAQSVTTMVSKHAFLTRIQDVGVRSMPLVKDIIAKYPSNN